MISEIFFRDVVEFHRCDAGLNHISEQIVAFADQTAGCLHLFNFLVIFYRNHCVSHFPVYLILFLKVPQLIERLENIGGDHTHILIAVDGDENVLADTLHTLREFLMVVCGSIPDVDMLRVVNGNAA